MGIIRTIADRQKDHVINRARVARVVRKAIKSDPTFKFAMIDEEHTGPLGGISHQFYLYREVKGELHTAIISVYSDDRTDVAVRKEIAKLEQRKADEKAAKRAFRKA